MLMMLTSPSAPVDAVAEEPTFDIGARREDSQSVAAAAPSAAPSAFSWTEASATDATAATEEAAAATLDSPASVRLVGGRPVRRAPRTVIVLHGAACTRNNLLPQVRLIVCFGFGLGWFGFVHSKDSCLFVCVVVDSLFAVSVSCDCDGSAGPRRMSRRHIGLG